MKHRERKREEGKKKPKQFWGFDYSFHDGGEWGAVIS